MCQAALHFLKGDANAGSPAAAAAAAAEEASRRRAELQRREDLLRQVRACMRVRARARAFSRMCVLSSVCLCVYIYGDRASVLASVRVYKYEALRPCVFTK